MYRSATAILAVPRSPRTILARIGLPLCLRGWGIRPLGVSLVFSVLEAGSFRHFPLCASCARVRSPLRRDFDFHRLSLLARRLTTRRTRILTYSLLFFSLNSIHTSSITTAALVIRRQNGHCGLSTQQSLLILVDHTASSNQAFDYCHQT